ncbi:MAG: UpxY family transcription antiterminator [Acidobacteriaceae bacterium]|nr:UpxY family transcription antiterminator [Acidobacteriaceae bacterium]
MKNGTKLGWDSSSGALSLPQNSERAELTTAASVLSAEWYAIETRYRFERKVTVQLQRQGFETFLPAIKQIHRWSDRRKVVDTPLFPGYTFARTDSSAANYKQILQTAGVVGLITFSGAAAPVPAKQIEDLRKLLSQDVPCALHPFLKAGQKVRIRGGCLDGLEGVLAGTGRKHLVISIDSIQQAIAITIDGYELELV